ncbi:FAD/NAD(P)-binding protein [Pseudomonas sp. RIT-PI-S]|uniref:FAD/NAD(P)-binding protein n=1 Tax=Pseudomonas sp. RIT-PI-S TaxID=3035295 RepID=UPI0021DB4933|nr:FAD/NAD(P)-binding protein [Pseudomonas sp. RIT-PI-S]
MTNADVLIIGGGLSGTLLAMQLLRLPGARHIVVFEPRAELGRGEAYSATELGHTLNANAARMSVDPDAPDDLTHWLAAHIAAGGWPEAAAQAVPVAELFPPRALFGRYAQRRLDEALAAAPRSSVEHVRAEVVDLFTHQGGACVEVEGGKRWFAPRAVLATGVFAASRTRRAGAGLATAFAGLDPWDVNAMAQVPANGRVLIVGAGLTMIDALVSLQQAGHRGPIQVFSRHGLLPQPRRQPPPWPDFLAQTLHASPRQLSAELRRQCRLAQAQGVDWQAPLDTVRAHVGRLWSHASEFQRRQFVRHLRPWWESHHHRSPPLGAALLAHLQAAGRLHIEAAALLEATGLPEGVQLLIRRRGEQQPVVVQGCAVINSSGIEYDWRRVDKPLPRQLLARGLVRPGPLALGIDAHASGAVVDAQGSVSQVLFALGPPLRGLWWESTAVTDVAAQAQALARLFS